MPSRMPALGFSAVPLPTNNRRMLPGSHDPTAEAPAATTTDEPNNDSAPPGSPLLVAAANLLTEVAELAEFAQESQLLEALEAIFREAAEAEAL